MGVFAHRTLGALLFLAGLAWSPWAVDFWIGSAEVEQPLMRGLLLVPSAGLLVLGLMAIARRPSRALVRLELILLALFLALPLAGEALLRFAIATGRPGMMQAELYADPMADEDYWLIRAHWFGDSRVNPNAMDAELGWGYPASARSPLAFLTETPRQVDPSRPALLFFGDSFVAGPCAIEEHIPQQLDPLLPELPVLNYGVGGYGLDQICLRFERFLPRFPQGLFVVGVMTFDIDRALLRYRSGQKPWVEVEDGRLVVRGQPIDMDGAGWLERHPPAIRSYFLARLVRWTRAQLGGRGSEGPYKRGRKVEVATLLFERVVESARAHGRPLLFVIFDPVSYIGAPGWRETLCRELAERHGVPWVDAGGVLLEEAVARGVDVDVFFRPGDRHPTAEANGLIARAIAARVRELGWIEQAADAPR